MTAVDVAYDYQFTCDDSGTPVIHTLTAREEPTTCPFDPSHVLDVNSITIINTLTEQKAIISEDVSQTNGNYRAKGLEFSITAGPDTEMKFIGDYSYPYPVRVQALTFKPSTDNIGDSFSVFSPYQFEIGELTAAVSSGSVLDVDSVVILNVLVGYDIYLEDGGTTQELGEITNVDTDNLQITVTDTIANSFSIGTKVKLSVRRLCDIYIVDTQQLTFGISKIGGALSPSGMPGTIFYKNNTASVKTIHVDVELVY